MLKYVDYVQRNQLSSRQFSSQTIYNEQKSIRNQGVIATTAIVRSPKAFNQQKQILMG